MGTAKPKSIDSLSPGQLRRRTDPEQLSFDSTADLPELPIFVGQERPISAIRFGVKMDRPGYNIFALGPAGLGKFTLVHSAVQERAAAEVLSVRTLLRGLERRLQSEENIPRATCPRSVSSSAFLGRRGNF